MSATTKRASRRIPERSPSADQQAVDVFPTALGWIALAWHGERLARVSFGHPSALAAASALEAAGLARGKLPPAARTLRMRFIAFARGKADDFRDVPLALEHLSTFQAAVVEQCRRIGYGKTLSYAQLAAKAGSPRAARAVGSVMRTNRLPLVVPCHRVIASGGKLGGYSAPDGLAMKERLLALERRAK